MICQFVGADGEQIALQGPPAVVVREAIEEADERFLNNILRGRAITETTLDEGQETALVAGYQVVPSVGVTRSNSFNEETIRLRSMGHRGAWLS